MDNDDDTLWFGRVVFNIPPNFPEYLSSPNQFFPFVIGPEATAQVDLMRDSDEVLKLIGFEKDWIMMKRHQGYQFHFIKFRHHDKLQAVRASWDGLFDLVQRVSPECFERISPFLDELKTREYSSYSDFDIENMSALEYSKVCSFESFASNSIDTLTVTYARAFFRHALKCTSLFRGDGYTYDEYGNRGVDEYVVRRMLISDLTSETPRLLS